MIIIAIIFKLVIRYVTPPQTRQQKQTVKLFVDKLQRLSETVQTPKVILLFHIIRDIAAPKEHGFIGELSLETFNLKSDFKDLETMFRNRM